jgi:flavin-dependent dehydrogenase
VPKSYFDRVLLVGDAGGFTKPTTGGGIFYSLLTATLAAHTLIDAFRADHFDEGILADYERRWHGRIGPDLCVSEWLRHVITKCDDKALDRLVHALAGDDIQDLIRETARFNWHRGVIAALLHQPRVTGILFRSLFG